MQNFLLQGLSLQGPSPRCLILQCGSSTREWIQVLHGSVAFPESDSRWLGTGSRLVFLLLLLVPAPEVPVQSTATPAELLAEFGSAKGSSTDTTHSPEGSQTIEAIHNVPIARLQISTPQSC